MIRTRILLDGVSNGRKSYGRSHIIDSQMAESRMIEYVKWSNGQNAESSDCRIVIWSNAQVVECPNGRIVKWLKLIVAYPFGAMFLLNLNFRS